MLYDQPKPARGLLDRREHDLTHLQPERIAEAEDRVTEFRDQQPPQSRPPRQQVRRLADGDHDREPGHHDCEEQESIHSQLPIGRRPHLAVAARLPALRGKV